MKVHSLKEAESFFLQNSEGSVLCVRHDGAFRECECYPDAVEFYSVGQLTLTGLCVCGIVALVMVMGLLFILTWSGIEWR